MHLTGQPYSKYLSSGLIKWSKSFLYVADSKVNHHYHKCVSFLALLQACNLSLYLPFYNLIFPKQVMFKDTVPGRTYTSIDVNQNIWGCNWASVVFLEDSLLRKTILVYSGLLSGTMRWKLELWVCANLAPGVKIMLFKDMLMRQRYAAGVSISSG